ncbi:ArsR/SmtB family transcription factor [Nocardioides bruguierae]|uniref:ArsR/SmtB family transcription factor n=1 Tax=Nocardioides bruguierae TaxID=2945102 RepID=UPI00202082D1|nr:helix-turn-helix domain-containing protein [Nocardioides bruguierae]MCL8023906.1 helix-turn-helix domain-containing protein [Nocardioides bruguierae]
MPESSPRPADATALRAIAHPVRSRVLAELDAVGPMRAADVAAAIGVPANQASFHLRQLAKYGLVREAPEHARDRRDRVWEIVPGMTDVVVSDASLQPGGDAVARVFLSAAAAKAHRVVDAVFAAEREPGVQRSVTEAAVRLTKDEAEALGQEIAALVDARVRAHRGQDDGRRTYLLHTMLLPYPEEVAGEGAGPADGGAGTGAAQD